MRRFHVDMFLSVADLLGYVSHIAEESAKRGTKLHETKIGKRLGAKFRLLFDALEKDFTELGLTTCKATLEKIQKLVATRSSTYSDFRILADELRGRLIDEMSAMTFLALDAGEADHYNNPRKGWETIIGRFEDAAGDIEEARKCFALSRYAAAVFHSVQAIEFSLIELGKFLHVTDPRSGWTAVTAELRKIVQRRPQERTDFEKKYFDFLEQVQGTVEALKNAWRNKVSHAQGKPVLLSADFTPEIAGEILIASRSFMRRLADGLPPVDTE